MASKISLVGNVVRDPEVAQAAGQNVCRFSVATRTSAKDQEGNYVTNYYDVSLWGRRGDFVMQHAQKGTAIFVSGELVAATYQAKDGSLKTALRVNADSAEPIARLKGEAAVAFGAAAPAQRNTQKSITEVMNNDDIPF